MIIDKANRKGRLITPRQLIDEYEWQQARKQAEAARRRPTPCIFTDDYADQNREQEEEERKRRRRRAFALYREVKKRKEERAIKKLLREAKDEVMLRDVVHNARRLLKGG